MSKVDLVLSMLNALCGGVLIINSLLSRPALAGMLAKLDADVTAALAAGVHALPPEQFRQVIGYLLRWHLGKASVNWSRTLNSTPLLGGGVILFSILYLFFRVFFGAVEPVTQQNLTIFTFLITGFVGCYLLISSARVLIVHLLRRIAENNV